MAQGSVFRNSSGQAIQLTEAMAFPDDVTQVEIIVMGRTRVIAPAGEAWDSWFDEASVSTDFMTGRDQLAEPKDI
ncbi:type II toxin-antitoxin system VapB family antitoxin [Pseudomonas chlororaphis]|uniref:type II toxin-antitoxin system VapB family antitoxin n=1 Tax=Pseudomonas chlororaphis TaxID=587753 RepID=UPI000866323D|nr:type II toxin-antitoxin system VapB family antitoxin [Pseudomonas chlororaphis]BAV77121.1 antitoxin VapB [Pseudomonas chlororaphis subsp. aurantiaca]